MELETQIVVVYSVLKNSSECFFKPMGVQTITKDVNTELKAHEDAGYIIAQTQKNIRIKSEIETTEKEDPKTGEMIKEEKEIIAKPNKNGYYKSDDYSFEVVPITEGGIFRKRSEKTEKGLKTPFTDFHKNKDGKSGIVVNL